MIFAKLHHFLDLTQGVRAIRQSARPQTQTGSRPILPRAFVFDYETDQRRRFCQKCVDYVARALGLQRSAVPGAAVRGIPFSLLP